MDSVTREELLRENAALRSRLAELEDRLASMKAYSRGSLEPGWLIITPNPSYYGDLYEVHFEAGKAFIPERMPNAAELVRKFVGDFGYRADKVGNQ